MSSLTANRKIVQGRDVILYSWNTGPFASFKLTLIQAQGVASPAVLASGWPGAGYGSPPLYSIQTPTYLEQRLNAPLDYFSFFTGEYKHADGIPDPGIPVVKPSVCNLLIEFFDRDGNLVDSSTAMVSA